MHTRMRRWIRSIYTGSDMWSLAAHPAPLVAWRILSVLFSAALCRVALQSHSPFPCSFRVSRPTRAVEGSNRQRDRRRPGPPYSREGAPARCQTACSAQPKCPPAARARYSWQFSLGAVMCGNQTREPKRYCIRVPLILCSLPTQPTYTPTDLQQPDTGRVQLRHT